MRVRSHQTSQPQEVSQVSRAREATEESEDRIWIAIGTSGITHAPPAHCAQDDRSLAHTIISMLNQMISHVANAIQVSASLTVGAE